MTLKYVLHHASPAVLWPGFHIETKTGNGAAKLAEELNRLDRTVCELRSKHGNQAESLRHIRADREHAYAELTHYKDLVDRSRGVLGKYLAPLGPEAYTKKGCITALLDILDNAESVASERANMKRDTFAENYGAHLRVSPGDVSTVVRALDQLAMTVNNIWPDDLRKLYEDACRIMGVSDDGDVTPKKSVETITVKIEAGEALEEIRRTLADTELAQSIGTKSVLARVQEANVFDLLQEAIKETGYLVESFPTSSAFKEHLAILLTEQCRRLGIPELEEPAD